MPIGIQLGRRTITGARAVPLLALVIIAVMALLYLMWRDSWAWAASGALWLAFTSYWGAAARGAAPAKQSESSASRALHVRLLAAAFALLFLPLPGLTQHWLPPGWVPRVIGLCVQLLGFLLAASARRHLGRNWSGNVRVAEEHELVQSGPYRFIRHPIYSAMLLMFAGTAVASTAVHALVGTVVLFVAYARKIQLEEETLTGAFGDAYETYRQRTWALVPFLV